MLYHYVLSSPGRKELWRMLEFDIKVDVYSAAWPHFCPHSKILVDILSSVVMM